MKLHSALSYLIPVGLFLGVASCASTPVVESDRSWSFTPAASSLQPLWSDVVLDQAIAVVDQTIPKTMTATLYTADASCSNFEAKTVDLPRERAIARAVGVVLADESVTGIPLTGYRVEQRLGGTVRVDLRFTPDMPRSVYALSHCEQFALFGSIRTTLIQNSQWQVTQVIFTERGKELAL